MWFVLNYFLRSRGSCLTQIPQGLPLKSLCTFNHQVESQRMGRREGLEAQGLDFSWRISPSAVHGWCLLPPVTSARTPKLLPWPCPLFADVALALCLPLFPAGER